MSSPRLRAYATLALTFALGAGAGGSLVFSLVRREQAHPPRPDPGERLAALSRRLGLRPEQQAAVGAVFDRYREARKQERARMDAEVRALLDPGQIPRFEEMIREREHNFGPPGGPPGGPPR